MHTTKVIQSLLLAFAWWLVGTMRVFAEPLQIQEATMDEIQQALASGKLTSEALVNQYFDRIAAFDQQGPRLNSIISLNPVALDTARALDQERAQTGPRGPLHGIPILVKDNIDTFDMPTTAGSLALQGSVPPDDAFIVRRLRDAGAILLGKTNLQEFAAGFATTSGLGGQTLNPYDITRIPGGSSGGTAAAIAANFAVAGLGTDTAGSIRYPAAVTSLVGIKPTLGLTSRDGTIPLDLTKDVTGPIARTVTDAAILLDAIAGPDPADPITLESLQHIPASYTNHLKSDSLSGARLGVFRQMLDRPNADSGVMALHEAAIARMRSLGAEIVELPEIPDLPFAQPLLTGYPGFEYYINRYLDSLGDQAPSATLAELLASGLGAPWLAAFDGISPGDIPPEEVPLFHQIMQFRTAVRSAVLGVMDAANVEAIVYPTAVQPRLLSATRSQACWKTSWGLIPTWRPRWDSPRSRFRPASPRRDCRRGSSSWAVRLAKAS
jgi:Asp-tRNA(Asn)/Glu-tRNA(Gln) amidotransferase A subunit family amidase